MLFRWEDKSHLWVMVIMLCFSAIGSIVINQTTITGDKKLKILRFIKGVNFLIFVPGSLYEIVVNALGISSLEYVKMENAMWRFCYILGGITTLLVALLSIFPKTGEGLQLIKRKSITSSKYQYIFRTLRGSFMAIMVLIIISFWMVYVFS